MLPPGLHYIYGLPNLSIHFVLLVFRGATFRAAYSRLGEVRSLIPSAVNTMALTATVTKETFRVITLAMGMVKPHVILASPDESNIHYTVMKKMTALNLARVLTKGILAKVERYPKTIVFCRRWVTHSEL